MSAEGQTIPDETAQRVARLINEAEDMRAQAVDDLKTIYGDLREELKALGWLGQNISKEVAALKGAIAEIRLDDEKKAKRDEKGDRVDDYVSILSKAPARAPAHARENTEEIPRSDGGAVAAVKGKARLANAAGVEPPPSERFDPETGETLDVASRADGGLDIVTKHTEIATNEGGATEAIEEADQEGSNSHLEPSGPEAERATYSPETANVSLANGPCEAVSERTATQVDVLASAAAGVSGQPEAVPATSADRAGEAASAVLPTNSEDTDGITWETFPSLPMKSLPYASCFPELSKVEYDALTKVIKLQGVQEPIVRIGDVIVNGWNRYNIARSLGIEYPVIRYAGKDVLLDVIEMQREDRAWTSAQEQKIASRLAKEIPHRAADIMAAFSLTEAAEKEMA